MKCEIYAPYVYWKSVGTVYAETEEEAMEKAWEELEIEDSDSLCWQCEDDMMDHPMLDFDIGLSAICIDEK